MSASLVGGAVVVSAPSGGGAPSGPAGGDLGGTYPNPTVVSLAHVTAGGDLAGTMDAPTVVSLAHAVIGPAIYPAGDGSLLTNIAPPASLQQGTVTLDGSGNAFIVLAQQANMLVPTWLTSSPPADALGSQPQASPPTVSWFVTSFAGAANAGQQVGFIAF